MRFIMELAADGDRVKLPVNYNYLVQSALYAALDRDFATFLHDQGYEGGGRSFKLFSFSRLLGMYQVQGKEILFEGKIQLIVTSPVEQFFKSILNGLLARGGLRLGNSFLRLDGLEAKLPRVQGERMRLKLLSPVVAYRTEFKPDGRKFTHYFRPGEAEFTKAVMGNLAQKYQALYQREAPDTAMAITALKPPRQHVMEYKQTVIKGYSGLLELQGPQEMLQLALDGGLGSKNSMGFGCGELLGAADF